MRAWLALGGTLRAMSEHTVRDVLRASGVEWPHNVTRHSYVSHAVMLHGAKDVAMRAGHSEDMLFRHYRALVTRQQAEAYFAIRPA